MAKDFKQQISDLMIDLGDEIRLISQNTIRTAAKEAKKIVQEGSPKRTGEYSRNWTYTVEDTLNPTTVHAVVHNRKRYQLTHLLENGHWLVKGGALAEGGHIVKWVDAVPHLVEAQEKANEMFYDKLVEGINKL